MSRGAWFGVGVLVGLLLPWAALALRDLWQRRDTGHPEGLTARARKSWGR